ncbi:hypothetical protein J2TS4_12870 [Paenibacillus sp. J2TS4]|nr:hypothetical protein J2TS4_12870 [Paenibacillus sp. J2TS4]
MWSTPQHADDIFAFMDQLQIPRAHLIGYGMGGFDAHQGNWQEFLRQKLKDWRTYPRLTDDQLRSISCPALFVAGEYDELTPEEDLKRVTNLIPDSHYVIVPGESHRPHMSRENPSFVNDTILDFLEMNS